MAIAGIIPVRYGLLPDAQFIGSKLVGLKVSVEKTWLSSLSACIIRSNDHVWSVWLDIRIDFWRVS